jgi:hypothetical protein
MTIPGDKPTTVTIPLDKAVSAGKKLWKLFKRKPKEEEGNVRKEDKLQRD